jgi:hypothetical protein
MTELLSKILAEGLPQHSDLDELMDAFRELREVHLKYKATLELLARYDGQPIWCDDRDDAANEMVRLAGEVLGWYDEEDSDGPDRTERYMTFCREASDRGAMYISSVEAHSWGAAMALGLTECLDDWNMGEKEDPAYDDENVVCIGVIRERDCEIMHWEDLSEN